MSPFWSNLDLLPSMERQRQREKPLRSAEKYSESREKVKEGVQEAKDRMKLNDIAAETLMYIELNEEALKEKLSEEDLKDVAAEFASFDMKQWGQMAHAFHNGNFDIRVAQGSDGSPEISMDIDLPEGNIAENVKVSEGLREALISAAKRDSTEN